MKHAPKKTFYFKNHSNIDRGEATAQHFSNDLLLFSALQFYGADKNDTTEFIDRITKNFQRIQEVVISDLLLADNETRQQELFNFYVDVVASSLLLGNAQTAISLYLALKHQSISRLSYLDATRIDMEMESYVKNIEKNLSGVDINSASVDSVSRRALLIPYITQTNLTHSSVISYNFRSSLEKLIVVGQAKVTQWRNLPRSEFWKNMDNIDREIVQMVLGVKPLQWRTSFLTKLKQPRLIQKNNHLSQEILYFNLSQQFINAQGNPENSTKGLLDDTVRRKLEQNLIKQDNNIDYNEVELTIFVMLGFALVIFIIFLVLLFTQTIPFALGLGIVISIAATVLGGLVGRTYFLASKDKTNELITKEQVSNFSIKLDEPNNTIEALKEQLKFDKEDLKNTIDALEHQMRLDKEKLEHTITSLQKLISGGQLEETFVGLLQQLKYVQDKYDLPLFQQKNYLISKIKKEETILHRLEMESTSDVKPARH